MKRVWNSFLIAFAMFSKIPVPRADWDRENMRYMMCFFPGIGAVIGLFICGYGRFCALADFSGAMRSAGFVLIPVLVTGGVKTVEAAEELLKEECNQMPLFI